MGLQKKEETSKQTPDFVRHCIVFACLGEPKASQRDAQGEAQARKDKQALGLRPSLHQCLLVFIWDSWYIKVSLTKEKTQWKKAVRGRTTKTGARLGLCMTRVVLVAGAFVPSARTQSARSTDPKFSPIRGIAPPIFRKGRAKRGGKCLPFFMSCVLGGLKTP